MLSEHHVWRRTAHRLLPLALSLNSNQFEASSHYSFLSPRFNLSQIYDFHTNTNPDLITLCSSFKSLCHIKQIHGLAIAKCVVPSSISLSTSLILSYAVFSEVSAFRCLFEQSLPFCSNAFLWNTLVRAFSIARIYDEFSTYNRMVRSEVRADDHTFSFVLKACNDYSEFQKGMEVHVRVIKCGFDFDVFVGNNLLAFYGRCGDLSDAKKVFDEMPERDVVSWNTVIHVFSANGFSFEALELFGEMFSRSDCRPNSVTIVTVLPVCGEVEDEFVTRQMHGYVVKVGFDFWISTGNALIDAYGKCSNADASKQVFNEMMVRNDVTWNAIISTFARTQHYKDALDVFRWMIDDGVKPDAFAVSTVLPVLVELQFINLGMEIHGIAIKMGIESDVFIGNSLIVMYAKAGHPTEASKVFCYMKERDIVSWSAMVANTAQNGEELASVELIREMQIHGESPDPLTLTNVLPACGRGGFLRPGKEIHAWSIKAGSHFDTFVSNALMDMYAKCNCLDVAQKVFDFSIKDEVSYNILIKSYSQTSHSVESLTLFREMRHLGMKHDVVSFMGAIAACGKLSAIKPGKEIHGSSVRSLHKSTFVANSLLDLYIKCGRIDLAERVFKQIPNKDEASWNTMILGFGMVGELDTAFRLFEAMREESEHDQVSYLAVLSACSHGGLVEKGKSYFKEMQNQGIEPTELHITCMVDLLGRAGLIDEALGLINSLSSEPGSDALGALLGACRIHGNVELGQWVAERLLELKPEHCGYYVLLSNMYAEAGKWDEARKVREEMKARGAKKSPGCSWVHVSN